MDFKIVYGVVKKFLSPFFHTRAAGLYLLLFAASIGVATFIENDFGTSAAQKVVFKAWWFELLLILFGITVLVNIFRFRMIQQKKWALLLFHLAIVIIIIGAGVTRYLGYEGVMHIRENSASNSFLSSNTYLNFHITREGKPYVFEEPVLFASLGNNQWEQSYLLGNDLIRVRVREFIPNPKQILQESPDGAPTLHLVMAGVNGRENYFLSSGETRRIGALVFNFREPAIPGALNFSFRNDSLLFQTDRVLSQTVMATQKRDTVRPSDGYVPLALRALYTDGSNNFVFPEFVEHAIPRITSEGPKVKNESQTALRMEVAVNGQSQEAYLFGQKGVQGKPETLSFGDTRVTMDYGSREVRVPFQIALNDFIMDKYPGTNSASSYASEVTLNDASKNVEMNYRIYMNNILNYGGYRFFQSSFDKDEQGTYLSVNNDYWGTHISYLGYTLLAIGMILTFFSKNTRFYQLTQKIRKLRSQGGSMLLLACLIMPASSALAQASGPDPKEVVSAVHAGKFSELVVQDFRGRMKPVHTLSREVMRKLSRKESLYGLNADQIVLSMFANPQGWYHLPLIKLGTHEAIHRELSVAGDLATYAEFFTQSGSYKLQDAVSKAYGMEQADRGMYEKELMKVDERVNIMSMILSGSLFKIIPNPNDPAQAWASTHVHAHGSAPAETPQLASDFFQAYRDALVRGMTSGDYAEADRLVGELKSFQQEKGGDIVPSETKIHAEIFLNKLNIFTRLAGMYMILGVVLLFFLFLSVFKPEIRLKNVYRVLFALILIGFAFHTIGLGIRWYVSGRAPWSNGYESMIYIAWTTTLAGLIFTRKSFGGLAATMVLAGIILFVATLSFLDPEITPLVPVLKSYWLTIHVSMEAGSYGFLMLGAIIGILNLSLMIFLRESNKNRVKRMVTEMSHISELTLIGGLFMVSIGTFLGGVWANESWGRYWGWDAKETWALVTILVYAFILHMRLIPKLKGLFAYNLATVFGLATVIMTYYGVNYYLSGLHSYATGDPIPVPTWVYIVVLCLVLLSGLAYIQKRKYAVIS